MKRPKASKESCMAWHINFLKGPSHQAESVNRIPHVSWPSDNESVQNCHACLKPIKHATVGTLLTFRRLERAKNAPESTVLRCIGGKTLDEMLILSKVQA